MCNKLHGFHLSTQEIFIFICAAIKKIYIKITFDQYCVPYILTVRQISDIVNVIYCPEQVNYTFAFSHKQKSCIIYANNTDIVTDSYA